jgi:phage terminase large subunit-like protein
MKIPAEMLEGMSNTEAPEYYAEFREKVLRGEIPVNREISLEMNRIDALIANPNIYYDPNAINGFILFCENEMTLTDGSDLHLLPTFKLWAEQIFAWWFFVERSVYEPSPSGGRYITKVIKKRLTNKQYLIVARGAAKSLYETLLQAYFLIIDTQTTHQITTAPTMKQADEVMSAFSTAITISRGPLFQFLTEGSLQNTTGSRANRQKLASTKKGVESFMTNSLLEVRPMSVNKLQGLRPKMSTVDEWLSGDLREDVIGAIEQGASKLDDWLIVAVSSEGTVRNGAGDTMKMELAKILRGEYQAPHISIWHYKLDEIEEVNDPAMWPKAQPNIGMTVTYDTYHLDVERAEKAPASRNDILAKRFGIPMEGYTYFFTYEDTVPFRRQLFDGLPCAMGVDLSQGDDFCAFTFLFPIRQGFGVKTRSYITSLTLAKLPGAMRYKYEEFINEGSLHVLEGTILDMMEVYDDLDAHIQHHEYDIRSVGFDPYNAKEFMTRWEQENGPYGIEKVIQGSRTESVPLGELKILASERKLIFDEDLMQFAMGNAITLEDTNGNRKLLKTRYQDKIDNVSALMDAYISWKLNKEAFE